MLAKKNGLLEPPLAASESIHLECDVLDMLSWGIFNPMGPTLSLLSLLTQEGSSRLLVHYRMLNPFSQQSMIIAAVDKEIDNPALVELIGEAFVKNDLGNGPLVGALPTIVICGENPSASRLAWYCLFRHVYENGREAEMTHNLQSLRRFIGKPWDRLTLQKEGASRIAEQHDGSQPSESTDPADSGEFSEFDKWKELLLSDEHLLPEIRGFMAAWKGSIEFHAKSGTGLDRSAMSLKELVALLFRSNPSIVKQLGSALEPNQSGA